MGAACFYLEPNIIRWMGYGLGEKKERRRQKGVGENPEEIRKKEKGMEKIYGFIFSCN